MSWKKKMGLNYGGWSWIHSILNPKISSKTHSGIWDYFFNGGIFPLCVQSEIIVIS